MSKMIIFPGQGSQSIGMGKDLYDNFDCAKHIFTAVDDALGQKLSDIIFNGSDSDLTLTQNTQPALMCVSMALLAVLHQEYNIKITDFSYAAGHSLGEYTALCSAGVFSLADTAKLLRIRGQSMQQAVPVGVGAMVAILGLSFDEVLHLTQQTPSDLICEPANDNADGQIVISGHMQAVNIVSELAKQAGAKRVVPLSVSAPFHCQLMQPAADKMSEALGNVPMNDAIIPIIANVLVQPITDKETIKQALIHQVTGRVRWRETMQWASSNAITHIYEVGAGKVLSGMCKRAVKDANVCTINTFEDMNIFERSKI